MTEETDLEPDAEQSSLVEDERRELYTQAFEQPTSPSIDIATLPRPGSAPQSNDRLATVPTPRMPRTMAEADLSPLLISELVLKTLYLHGSSLGIEIARHLRLPFGIVEGSLTSLKTHKAIEVSSGEVIGAASYQFHLTETGIRRAKEAFERCGYVGPAPVSLAQYSNQCRAQAVGKLDCTPEILREVLDGLVLRDGLLSELGPAVCSGQSVFIYGSPGNGKTLVARALGKALNQCGGDIYVPYAVHTENAIITLLDPTVHQVTDDLQLTPSALEFNHDADEADARWRRIRRPIIVTAGELTLDMLDLSFHESGRFYIAPLHIKANGGMLLIDDFGRQRVSPRDLLNRWILPLEERSDFLTLATGRKSKFRSNSSRSSPRTLIPPNWWMKPSSAEFGTRF